MSMGTPKKKGPPQIFTVDKALKLAERWVSAMSRPAEDEPTDIELEGRPDKLGLGAKVSRQSKRGPSDDPLDQKLQAKLDAGRRKHARIVAESTPSAKRIGDRDSEEDDDESESKSRAFGKKKAVPVASSLQPKKK